MSSTRHKKQFRVVELFAGVGGFRLGLEGLPDKKKSHNKRFNTIWFNQWEPTTKRQHAHEVYVSHFGDVDEYTNIDVAKVTQNVPPHDLLVGGFPCQDYSVARNLSTALGLKGKKGSLWWSIYEILLNQGKKAPSYILLENVDRLLSSPATQRGRDFAVMLSSLNNLGYVVEWRVINAADYGFPQRRRRIFILAYKKGSPIYKKRTRTKTATDWVLNMGVFQKTFPVTQQTQVSQFAIESDLPTLSATFESKNGKSPFENSGVCEGQIVTTMRVEPLYDGSRTTIKEILIPDSEVPKEYLIDTDSLERWVYLKGSKSEKRKAKNGFEFNYTEGAVAFPEPLNKPSRTIITGEGGPTPSRFKHVVKTRKGLRRLTPIELERLNMFPDDYTIGHSDSRRAFFMGNALVVGVIDEIGRALIAIHDEQ